MSRILGTRMAQQVSSPEGAWVPAAPQPFSDGSEDDGSISLREALKLFRRRRLTILVSAAVLSAIGIAAVLSLTPRFTADAVILVGNHRVSVADPQMPAPATQPDPVTIQNQVDILQSRTLAERVTRELGLQSYAEFNPTLGERSTGFLTTWLRSIFAPEDVKRELTPAEIEARTLDQVMQRLQAAIKISNDGRSDVIKIESESQDPKLAATIANAYVNAYLVDQLEAKYDDTKRATAWLDARLSELRDRVRESENAVHVYQENNKLDEIKGATVIGQQITDLTTQLVAASGDRAQKEANLAQVQRMLRSPGGAAAAGQVLTSATIQALQTQEAEVRRKQAELANTYGPQHPMMISMASQINDIRRKIQEEVGKIVQSMGADVAASRAREETLRSRLQELQNAAAKQSGAQIQLRQLQSEATANQTLYQNFLTRFKLSSAEKDLPDAEARLVASAREPRQPSFPRIRVMIPIVVILSLVVGTSVALVQELLDSGFRSAEQVEQLLGLPLLGMLPDVGRERPADVVVANPTCTYSESVRALATSLRYAVGDRPPKIIVVTSSVPQEGKSQLATSLARSITKSGRSVLLIECDLRRPGIQGILVPPDDAADLMHLFDGRARLSDVIVKDSKTGLDWIPASTTIARPQDFFESKKMSEFLASMASQYDLVVVDTPPIMAVSDAVALCHLADMTLFVVQYEKTPRNVAMNAVKALRASGAMIAGVVLSRTNMKKHARYGFGDYGYYLSRYGSYYERPSFGEGA